MPTALASPSQHLIVAAGVLIAVVLFASLAVARRDAWVPTMRAHATLLQRTVFGALIAVGLGLLIAHRDALEEVVKRVEGGDPKWLALGLGLELFSFAGYVILTKVVYASRAERLTNAACVELTLAGVVATRLFSAGGPAASRSPAGSSGGPEWRCARPLATSPPSWFSFIRSTCWRCWSAECWSLRGSSTTLLWPSGSPRRSWAG